MSDLTHKQYKQLRDMADGHLNLYASVRHCDEMTGELLAEPEVLYVGHDRPDIADVEWWRPLLAEGLIALPAPTASRNRCVVTLAGHEAVAAYRVQEADRG